MQPEAAAAHGLPAGHAVHRRPVGAAPEGVPDRRLRLEQAGRGPAADDPVAHLPGRKGAARSTAAPRSVRRRRGRAAAGQPRRSPPGSRPGAERPVRVSVSVRPLLLTAALCGLLAALAGPAAARSPLRCGNVRVDQVLHTDPKGLFGAFRIRAWARPARARCGSRRRTCTTRARSSITALGCAAGAAAGARRAWLSRCS